MKCKYFAKTLAELNINNPNFYLTWYVFEYEIGGNTKFLFISTSHIIKYLHKIIRKSASLFPYNIYIYIFSQIDILYEKWNWH
jgi:hypothetical protein